MKTKTIFLILIVAICAATGGWWAAKHFSHQHESDSGEQSGRKIKFYQCSMHPQVKSDKPGKCPICGMDLSPIFEGQGALSENLITLDSNSISVIHVQSEPVKRQAMQRTLHVAGMIEDDDTRHRIISAYNEGRVEKLFINYIGAEVEKDQPLAAFYSPNLLSAQREYLVLTERERTNDTANFQAEQKKMLISATQRLKRLGLTDAQIEGLGKSTNALAQTQIVSPLSGTVVARHVYEGQYVKEGDKLFEIADFSTMWFRFDAYENDLPWFKVGEEIEITTPSAPNKIYKAKINFIDPNISDSTRSAKVRVEIANPAGEQDGKKRRELLHKVYADGRLKVIFPETLVVPRSAVLNSGGDPIVYLDRGDGAYEPRKIKLGVSGDEGWQVREGLDEGDRVVTSGNLLIDAQAQFNQGGTSADAAPKGTEQSASKLPPLSEAQQKITTEFFAVASQISGALADDDFKAYNELVAKLPALLPTLTEAFAKDLERKKPIDQIERAGHLPKAEDLAAARKSFVPFSMATVELAKTLRGETNSAAVKIYKCPMASQAVPGAPKSGFWIQTKGPLHNPFFGSAMLDCGSEVKP